MATLAELQAELLKINSALDALYQNKRITQFSIGTGISKRDYKYNEITIEALTAERQNVEAQITALSPVEETSLQFRTGVFPLDVRKRRV